MYQFYLQPTVRGNLERCLPPHVNCFYSRYVGDALKGRYDLVGSKVQAMFDSRDVSFVRLYDGSGRELGILTAYGTWGRFKHSLTIRKAIHKYHRSHKCLNKDPVSAYMMHLQEKAKESPKAARQLARVQADIQWPVPDAETDEETQRESEAPALEQFEHARFHLIQPRVLE